MPRRTNRYGISLIRASDYPRQDAYRFGISTFDTQQSLATSFLRCSHPANLHIQEQISPRLCRRSTIMVVETCHCFRRTIKDPGFLSIVSSIASHYYSLWPYSHDRHRTMQCVPTEQCDTDGSAAYGLSTLRTIHLLGRDGVSPNILRQRRAAVGPIQYHWTLFGTKRYDDWVCLESSLYYWLSTTAPLQLQINEQFRRRGVHIRRVIRIQSGSFPSTK